MSHFTHTRWFDSANDALETARSAYDAAYMRAVRANNAAAYLALDEAAARLAAALSARGAAIEPTPERSRHPDQATAMAPAH